MNEIRFPHYYTKFHNMIQNNDEVELYKIEVIDRYDIRHNEEKYETEYIENGETKYDKLSQGLLINLYFKRINKPIVFSTIRPWSILQEAYYRKNVGKVFRLIINGTIK